MLPASARRRARLRADPVKPTPGQERLARRVELIQVASFEHPQVVPRQAETLRGRAA